MCFNLFFFIFANPNTMRNPAIAVIILYDDHDNDAKDKIVTHLRVHEKNGIICLWEKGMIIPGGVHAKELQKAINNADIVLFLASAESISSDKILEEELGLALVRYETDMLRIIPIIVSPCSWGDTVLVKFKPLPEGGKPLSEWKTSIDTPCQQIAEAVKTISKEIIQKRKESKKHRDEVPPEFMEIEVIFQNKPDEDVMKHMLFADYEGKPASAAHFAIYAQMLREIEHRMRTREHYNFYHDNLKDAKEVESIAHKIRERADLLQLDSISLREIWEALETASNAFRENFGNIEHSDPSRMSAAKIKYVHPFCNNILKIEKKLAALSKFSINIDLSDLSPN